MYRTGRERERGGEGVSMKQKEGVVEKRREERERQRVREGGSWRGDNKETGRRKWVKKKENGTKEKK